MAPQAGFEPATLRLTAGCSAVELLRNTGGCSARCAREKSPARRTLIVAESSRGGQSLIAPQVPANQALNAQTQPPGCPVEQFKVVVDVLWRPRGSGTGSRPCAATSRSRSGPNRPVGVGAPVRGRDLWPCECRWSLSRSSHHRRLTRDREVLRPVRERTADPSTRSRPPLTTARFATYPVRTLRRRTPARVASDEACVGGPWTTPVGMAQPHMQKHRGGFVH